MDPVERLQVVDMLKKRTRKNNWNYLCRHKEVRAIIRVILYEVIRQQPDNIYNFVAGLFHCENMDMITREVNTQMQRVNALMRNSGWNEYDGEMLFSTSSTISEPKAASVVDSILKYSFAEKESQNEDVASENALSESVEVSVKNMMD